MVSRYQYKVEFVVKPLMVLALYGSVFYCMCCLFGFHLGAHIKSDDFFCCTVIIYNCGVHLHLSCSVHKLCLCICCEFRMLNIYLGKQCTLSH